MLFGPPEEIGGYDQCGSSHLYRWKIFGSRRFKVYLHHSVGKDCNRYLCTYPREFISFGLAETVTRQTATGSEGLHDRAAWMVLVGKSSPSRETSLLK